MSRKRIIVIVFISSCVSVRLGVCRVRNVVVLLKLVSLVMMMVVRWLFESSMFIVLLISSIVMGMMLSGMLLML